jgi:hypothetical protein
VREYGEVCSSTKIADCSLLLIRFHQVLSCNSLLGQSLGYLIVKGDEQVHLHFFLYWNIVSAYISDRTDLKVTGAKRDYRNCILTNHSTLPITSFCVNTYNQVSAPNSAVTTFFSYFLTVRICVLSLVS